jgi:hypothetical protein
MKTFFRAFYKSILSPPYYTDIMAARPSFSIKYYIILALILTVVNTIVGAINYAPSLKRDLTASSEEIIQSFPQDLELNITPAGITANKDFPLIAQTPSALKGLPKNLAVIDPNGEVGMLQKYDALVLINNSYIIVGDSNNIQTVPLKDLPETTINYDKMQNLSETLSFVAKFAWLFTSGAFVLSGIFNFFVWRLIYLAAFSLGIWLMYKTSVGSYVKSLQINLHSITLPLLISTILGIGGIYIPFPGWFLLIHTVFTFYVLSRLEKSPKN